MQISFSRSSPRQTRCLVAAALFGFLGVAPTTVAAATNEEGEAALSTGVELRKKGDPESALHALYKAYAALRNGQAAAQLGLAHQALGQWPQAAERLTEALTIGGDEPWIRKNRAPLEEALAFVHQHVGTIEVSGSPPGAEVRVEGRIIGDLPLTGPAFAPAGSVALEVREFGYLTVVRNTLVGVGQFSHEHVDLLPIPSEAAAPSSSGASAVRGETATVGHETETPRAAVSLQRSTPAASKQPTTCTLAFSATGAASGLAMTSILSLVARSNRAGDLSSKLSSGACVQMGSDYGGPSGPACVDLATSKDRWTGAAVVTGVLALAAGTTAILLFSLDSTPTTPTRSISLLPLPGGATAAVGWTF